METFINVYEVEDEWCVYENGIKTKCTHTHRARGEKESSQWEMVIGPFEKGIGICEWRKYGAKKYIYLFSFLLIFRFVFSLWPGFFMILLWIWRIEIGNIFEYGWTGHFATLFNCMIRFDRREEFVLFMNSRILSPQYWAARMWKDYSVLVVSLPDFFQEF